MRARVAQRGAQPTAMVFRHADAQPHQLGIGRRGEPPRDLQIVLVRLPVVPGPREPRRPPHRPRVLLGGRRVPDVPPLVQRRELPPRRKRLRMRRHVVVQDLEGAGRLLPPPQPLQRRGLRHQRLPPQRKPTVGDGRIQMDQRLLPFPGPRQPPPQVKPQPVPIPVLRELPQHPPQQRNPIPPPHPRQAPPQQMQRIRRQFTVRQLGRSQPFLRLGPPPPPQRIATQPVRSRSPSPSRQRSVIGDGFQSLLPIRPRLDRRGSPHRRQPILQFLQRLPRNPGELLGRLARHPDRNRHQDREGPDGDAQMAPPAWNAGFSRHSPPPAGGARIATPPHGTPGLERSGFSRHMPACRPGPSRVWQTRPDARTQEPRNPRLAASPRGTPGLEPPVSRPARAALRAAHVVTPPGNRRLQPRRGADQRRWRPRLGAPASGRHRAQARNPR